MGLGLFSFYRGVCHCEGGWMDVVCVCCVCVWCATTWNWPIHPSMDSYQTLVWSGRSGQPRDRPRSTCALTT
jgi:hypothetical protein